MTLDLKPKVAAALQALAASQGLSIEDYLTQLIEKELPPKDDGSDTDAAPESGMVWEDGLFVYRTGRPLPERVLEDAVRLAREERVQQIDNQFSATRPPQTPAEIRAWLDSLAQFSDKIPPLPETISREWIYQEHN